MPELMESSALPTRMESRVSRFTGLRIHFIGIGGSGMAGPVAVVLALGPEHEAVQAIGLADGVEAILAAGQELVHVGLVADIEDEVVRRRVKDVVHCDRQFDDAQVWANVSARLGHASDQPRTDLLGKPFQLHHPEPLHILWRLNPV